MALHASRWRRAAGLLGIAIGIPLIGCASPTRIEWPPDAMREEVRRRAADVAVEEIVVPYEVEAEPLARAQEVLRGEIGAQQRIQALVGALSDPNGFGLRYVWAATAPANETLAAGGGNCFSLSSVLIGLARGLGFRAYYVEVEVANPEWRQTGSVAIHADHIAAVIVSAEGRQYVDFSGRLDGAHRLRVIDDLEALAHFYNNRGYELLYLAEREGVTPPWEAVQHSFQLATRIQPDMARAWNNLGVARSHLGDSAGAASAYRAALALEEGIQSAHLNLVVLYLRVGDLEAAEEHLSAAERLDPRNPQLQELRATLDRRRAERRDALGG
jgi:tetratricopeptide (TPR) repeat protein